MLNYSNLKQRDLIKKIVEYEKDSYKFNEVMIITMKNNSHLSYMKFFQYSKLFIPRLHVDFFRILSEKPPTISTLIDGRNPTFYSYQQMIL